MILLFQNGIGLLSLLPWLRSQGIGLFKTKRRPFLIFRSLVSLTAIGFSFVAIQKISLVNTMLFTNASPLWIPFVCLLWLKVPIRHILWPGLIGGFLGIILILQPGGNVINGATLFALAAGVLQSINMVAVRELSHTERSHTVMFYYFLVCTLVCLPWSWVEWVQPTPLAWGQMITIGVLLTCGQWSFVRAFHHANASDLGPFCYSAVVYSLLIDWALYNQFPDLWAWLGIILVCAGGIWAIRNSQK